MVNHLYLATVQGYKCREQPDVKAEGVIFLVSVGHSRRADCEQRPILIRLSYVCILNPLQA